MGKIEERAVCAAILTNAMYGLGMKPENYPAFFEAAIKKAGTANMLEATSQSGWPGVPLSLVCVSKSEQR